MFDKTLRRRLEVLNREPLSVGRASSPDHHDGGGVHSRVSVANGTSNGVFGQPRTADLLAAALRPDGSLLETGEIVENSAGKHLRIVQSVESIWRGGERLIAARHALLAHAPPREPGARSLQSPDRHAECCGYESESLAFLQAFPDRALFLDLETCGLAGAALFLVGLLRRIDGRLAVELLLARNYAEEHAVLVSLWERAAAHDVLVTFNGKSFDWPMVLDRSTRYLIHRTSVRPQLVHVDVLHHARRRWRARLPDCKLQTLERYICGRRREGDIPGPLIPAAYQRFVQSGDAREMESILFHNAIDLVTLLDLSMRLAGE